MVATSRMNKVALVLGLAVGGARAHVAAWAKGMYCQNGPSNIDAPNTWYASEPLVALPYSGWFMHGACKHYPPKDPNEFLILPAGGQFTVEHATDKAFTTLAYNGTKTSDWPDGEDHPANYGDKHPDPRFPLNELGCISQPNMHCKNEGHAAGTAFAIAYKSDINQVTIDDLVVFTVRHNTPYKRVTTYDVPKYLPECPPGGCICAWGWVPDGCGQANEYMLPYRCKVTNVSPNAKKLGKPQDPKWCEGKPSECYNGPKKMSIGNQKERNTVDATRQFAQANGQWATYTYNDKLGFSNGAQENIYEQGSDDGKTDTPSTSAPKPTGNTTTKSSSAPPKSTTTTKSADPKPTSSEEEVHTPSPSPSSHSSAPVHSSSSTTTPSTPAPKPTEHHTLQPSSSSTRTSSRTSHSSSSSSASHSSSADPKPEPTETQTPSSEPKPEPTETETPSSVPTLNPGPTLSVPSSDPESKPTTHEPVPIPVPSETESSSDPFETPGISIPTGIQPPMNFGSSNSSTADLPTETAAPETSAPPASATKGATQPKPVNLNNDDKPAVDTSGSGSNTSTNTGSNSSLTTANSKKKCRAYLGKRAALRKRSAHAQRRRGALSFLDHFKI